MKLICQNNISQLFDDGEYYRFKTVNKKDSLISKREEPQYPLALVLKWDFEPVDVNYLNNLSDNLDILYQKREEFLELKQKLLSIAARIKEEESYNLAYAKLDYIKENESIYLLVYKEKKVSKGPQLFYKIDKITWKYEVVLLPNKNNFKLLRSFEKISKLIIA